MKISGNHVTFQQKDWENGVAKRWINIFKEEGGKYYAKSKTWSLNQKTALKVKAYLDTLDDDELGEVLAVDKEGHLSIPQMVKFGKRVEDVEKFFEKHRDEMSEEIIDRFETYLTNTKEYLLKLLQGEI